MSIPLLREKQLAKKALGRWGIEGQEGMLIEEIGEVLQAWNKRERAVSYLGDQDIDFNMEDYLEELADLHIILDQLEIGYGEIYRKIKQKKLDRLEELLGEAEENGWRS